MKKHIQWVVRCGLAALFFWAAYAKIALSPQGPTLYQHWITLYPALRYLVPGAEILLGVWLLVGLRPKLASLATVVMISAFSGLLAMEMTREHPRPCGCMGLAASAAYDPRVVYWGLLGGLTRNVGIIIGAGFLFLSSGTAPTPKLPTPEAQPVTAG
jgi:hypothetical protein